MNGSLAWIDQGVVEVMEVVGGYSIDGRVGL